MQGVYIQMSVPGIQGLEELVDSNEGGVFLRSEGGFVKVLSQDQLESYTEREALLQAIGLAAAKEKTIALDDLSDTTGGARGVRGAVEWYGCWVRPKTKKALRESVATDPHSVHLEATSIFGNEFDGRLDEAPMRSYSIVGPDPGRDRSWFATISWSDRKDTWIVK